MTTVAPRSCTELFLAFNTLALQGFGGVMSVAQREIVERRQWLTNEEFVQEVALAQALPGPNVCNLALVIGDRHFGWRGAVSAVMGLVVVPLMIMLLMVMAYGRWSNNPMVGAALWGMGSVTAGMVAGTAIKLFKPLLQHPLGPVAAAALAASACAALLVAHWSMARVVLGLGGLGVGLTWWALHRQATRQAESDGEAS